MVARVTTRERILDASRRLFNKKGYAATTLAEIAASIGIVQGNLTYHFPTKRQIVAELQRRMSEQVQEQRELHQGGTVTDDYVDLLLFAMNHVSENRFLLRDRAQFADEIPSAPIAVEMQDDLKALRGLLQRAWDNDLFRRDIDIDLDVLARSLWIISRFWMDHLREFDDLKRDSWTDIQQGIEHHFATLYPFLTVSAKEEFKSALERASILSTSLRGTPVPAAAK